MNKWSKAEAVRVLRNSASTVENDDEVTLIQTVADYIDSTADHRGISDRRTVLAEIAMAYVEGYKHATGDRARDTWTALRAAGLAL